MDQKTVLMEKQIHSLEDLQSVIRLVEDMLKGNNQNGNYIVRIFIRR